MNDTSKYEDEEGNLEKKQFSSVLKKEWLKMNSMFERIAPLLIVIVFLVSIYKNFSGDHDFFYLGNCIAKGFVLISLGFAIIYWSVFFIKLLLYKNKGNNTDEY